MCYEFIVPIGDAEVSVMFTFQNGGTEVEGASAREDGVFAVSHEIFQCSYNEKNISKNNEKSEILYLWKKNNQLAKVFWEHSRFIYCK